MVLEPSPVVLQFLYNCLDSCQSLRFIVICFNEVIKNYRQNVKTKINRTFGPRLSSCACALAAFFLFSA